MISFWVRPKPGKALCLPKEVFWGWRKVLTWVLETAFPISQREQIPEFLQEFGSLHSLLSWLDCYRLLARADGSRGSAPPVLPLAVCGYVCAEIMQTVRVKKLGSVVRTRPTDLICGFWIVLFFSLFLFQLWSNKSFPELTHAEPKNRNAASMAVPAKPSDSPSQGRKHPQVSATEASTWGKEPMWFQDYIAG